MEDAQLRYMLEQAAQEGAKRALAEIGLSDQGAGEDVRDLRELLSAFRQAKRTVWDTAVRAVTMAILGAIAAGVSLSIWRSNQ
jgi:hypothetical protein